MRKVVLSATAKSRLLDLLEYLENNWSENVKNDFIKKLDKSLSRISRYPKSCPESIEMRGLHKCVVTKQNTMFYRISPKEIEVVSIFDSRQDPDQMEVE